MCIDYNNDRLDRPTCKLVGANLASGDPLIEDIRLAYNEARAAPSTEAWTYTYDTLGQLTRATNLGDAPLSKIFSYDLAGNMTAQSGIGAYTTPTQGPNALRAHAPLTAGNFTFVYDANGNVTRIFPTIASGSPPDYRTTVYDGENRPIRVTRDGVESTFAFAPDGTRLRKTTPAVPRGCPASLSPRPPSMIPRSGNRFLEKIMR